MPPPDPSDFDAAAAWFRDRIPMSDDEYEALGALLREQAFVIAGVTQLDLVTQVWEALDDAISKGTSFADFQDAVTAQLAGAWGGAYPYRVETIFRNWVQRAYSAGRYEVMTSEPVKEARPFWRFEGIPDDRQSEICEACNDTVLPADSPWWATHNPPLHHRCRSSVSTLTPEEAKDLVDDTAPDVSADEGFGDPPTLPYEPDVSQYPPPLVAAYQDKTG